MPAPEAEFIPWWAQAAGGLGLLITTIIGGVMSYRRGAQEEGSPRHVVLESADLADMRPVRDLIPLVRDLSAKLDRTYSIEQEMKGEFGEFKSEFSAQFEKVNERLEKIDREQEIERRLREREERRHER